MIVLQDQRAIDKFLKYIKEKNEMVKNEKFWQRNNGCRKSRNFLYNWDKNYS